MDSTNEPQPSAPENEPLSEAPGTSEPMEGATPSENGHSRAGEPWLSQLQRMIDEVAHQAGPALREVAVKAAELAAVAAEHAGPIAQKAASVTADVGGRVAVKSKEIAADLRRSAAPGDSSDSPDAATKPSDDSPGE